MVVMMKDAGVIVVTMNMMLMKSGDEDERGR